MKRDSEALKARTKVFAVRILRLYRSLPTKEARILGRQLLRSSTLIGANYRAACRGRFVVSARTVKTLPLQSHL
jgi:four helix bundle protein